MIIGDGIVLGAGGKTASIFVAGLSETDTVTASKDGKTIVGKWTQKPNPAYVVPDGYTQLEYIESTGTQYLKIPLNVLDYSTMELEVDSTWPSVATSNGSVDGNGVPSCFHIGLFKDSDLIQYGNGSADASTDYTVSDRNERHKYKNSLKEGKIYFDDVLVYSYTPSVSGLTASSFMGIFTWLNHDGSVHKNSAFQSSKKFGVKIWYDNKLKNELVPAKRNSDGAIGMYDLVTKAFFGNAGTGTFTAGSEVPQTFDGFLIDKIKEYGTWTVTATNGAQTATQDVLVDSANVFSVEMYYKLWLYKDGNECEDVTGGWQSRARGDYNHISSQLPTFIKNTSNFTVSIDSGDGSYSGSIETIKDIDLTKYSTLYVSCVSGQASTWSAVNAWACSRTVDKIVNDFAAQVELVSCDGTNTTKYINNVVKFGDISEITGLYDIAVSVDGKSQVTIDKIWLE